MASTFNLVRNSRVFFTTYTDANGVVTTDNTGIANTNTFELQVLDGFSFSQGTQQSVIQISEAGNVPVRGQRAFNTQLDPVEFSFSTYIRPKNNSGTVAAEEMVLWNALFSDKAYDSTGVTVVTPTALTRSGTTTPTCVITCSATNLTTGGIAIGDVFSIGGLSATVTNAAEWEGPVTLLTVAPTITGATTITVLYHTAPSTAVGSACTSAPSSMKLYKGATGIQPSTYTTMQHAFVHTGGSNLNQLQKFGMFFVVDNKIYVVDNCALDQASIDFGLDGIATVAWTGKGTALRALPDTAVCSTANPAVFSGAGNSTGTAAAKVIDANYITNKLSTMKLYSGIQNDGVTTYNVALTGGNITIANNINYVIPANLGVVNKAIGYFTGSRSITGNVTAYLRTGTNNSAQVLSDILTGTATTTETKFKTVIEVGGASNATHVDFKMNGVVLQVPTVETGDVMSTTINFTAQGYDPLYTANAYDLEKTNDLFISYFTTLPA